MMEQQVQQPDIRANAYANPMNNFQGSILYLTNPDQMIKKMELSFRGVHETKKGVYEQVGDPLMNEKGISSITGEVQAIVNQASVMSEFERKDIPMLMDFLSDTVCKDLMLNRVLYGITNPAARDKIFFEATTTCFVILKRGFEGGERRFWKGTQLDTTTTINQPQKKGLFSGLFGGNKAR